MIALDWDERRVAGEAGRGRASGTRAISEFGKRNLPILTSTNNASRPLTENSIPLRLLVWALLRVSSFLGFQFYLPFGPWRLWLVDKTEGSL